MRLRRRLLALVAVVTIVAVGCAAGAPADGAGTTPGSPGSPAVSSNGTSPGTAPAGGTRPGIAPADDATAAPERPEPWPADDDVEAIGWTFEGSTVTADGRSRTWHLYVPRSLPEDRPVPLLVALHGGTGWGAQFQRNSGFDAIAEANGFLVVFPDGVGVGPTDAFRTWNGGVCCGPAASGAVDDVGFLVGLVEELSATYDVDPDRVYAAGHSNGAVMAIRLACEAADTFVAVGFQAGTMTIDECDPAVPVSMLHLHGEADQNMPPQGGRGTRGISGVTWPPALDGLRRLAAAEDCPAPESVDVASRPGLAVQRWSPCADGTEIEYVLVRGADHGWIGPRGPLGDDDPAAVGPSGFASSEAIWAFLAAHPRASAS